MPYFKACIVSGLFLGILSLAQPFSAFSDTVKTYYKQYSIFTFDNQDYLCEPYQVQKDEWLYKIFRQKGEISAENFPKFLKIFKQLNPKLSNIDAIEPGHKILIPLKKVSRKAYEEKRKGVVEVPVLEFSTDARDEKLAAFIHRHTIRKGDTVSTLLDKAFLKKGGAVSNTGKEAFKRLNPDIKDIDKIFLGSRILIPDPSILSQPWFKTFLTQGTAGIGALKSEENSIPRVAVSPSLPVITPADLGRLKRYAQLVQATLAHQGQMVFPGRNKRPPQVLDLSQTPVLTDKNGQKILMLPPGTKASDINQDLLEGMKAYWKELRIQELNKALTSVSSLLKKNPSLDEVTKNPETLIEQVLEATPFSLQPPAPVPIRVGTVAIDISMARITHDSRPDILVNPGNVYGLALAGLAAKGNEVLTLSPGMTGNEILLLLLSKLGYTTWKNPSFNAGGQITQLNGIYAVRKTEKLFITKIAPSENTSTFLQSEGIKAIVLKGK